VAEEVAPAKVNLYLHVTGRRADGYHTLDSLAVFAGAADILTAEPAPDLSLTLTGRFGAALAVEPGNLVLRAAHALARHADITPTGRLALEKRLPIASGIGGGSADAAAALRLLARLWQLPLTETDLAAIALTLGADVPVCLASRPARMRGIGERLTPAPALPRCGLALVNPGVSVATADIFRARTGAFSAEATLPQAWPDAATMAADLAVLRNDLEPPAIALRPVIAEALAVLRAQPACLLARMSGSGATCYGLYPTAPEAQRAAEAAQALGWWSSASPLGE
jgi:4-diphosphocytidyl-2-C-methyl-D-erythritol kinase